MGLLQIWIQRRRSLGRALAAVVLSLLCASAVGAEGPSDAAPLAGAEAPVILMDEFGLPAGPVAEVAPPPSEPADAVTETAPVAVREVVAPTVTPPATDDEVILLDEYGLPIAPPAEAAAASSAAPVTPVSDEAAPASPEPVTPASAAAPMAAVLPTDSAPAPPASAASSADEDAEFGALVELGVDGKIVTEGFVPQPAESRSIHDLERIWLETEGGLGQRVAAVHKAGQELGLQNLDDLARSLLIEAEGGKALGRARLAREVAPDLPMAWMAEARALREQKGLDGKVAGVFLEALRAIPRNLEASLWVEGLLLRGLAWTLALGALAYVLLMGLRAVTLAAHDLKDVLPGCVPLFAGAALLGFILLLPASLGEGVFGLVLSVFAVAVCYASWRQRFSLAAAAAAWLVALFLVAPMASQRLEALRASSVLKLADAAFHGVLSAEQVRSLEDASAESALAREARAIWMVREGKLVSAERALAEMAESEEGFVPAFLLNNLANLKLRAHQVPEAVALYGEAEDRIAAGEGTPAEQAVVAFNLSRAFSEAFRLNEQDDALDRAQALSESTVTELLDRSEESRDRTRDLFPSVASLRAALLAEVGVPLPSLPIQDVLATGWVGQQALYGACAFLGLLALMSLLAGGGAASFRCSSCGRSCCPRCRGEGSAAEELCVTCMGLLRHPETIEVSLRIERIADLKAWNQRRGRRQAIAGLLIPGMAGLVADRPLMAFLSVLAAVFIPVAWQARGLSLPDPMLLGGVDQLLFGALGAAALLAYVIIVAILVPLRRGA